MKKYIDAQDLANEILLDRKNPVAYLFVEGESDNDFFAKFIDSKNCLIRVTHGNPKLLEVFEILQKHQADEKAFGVIDADFRRLDNDLPTHPHIFLTDTHDLETLIMQTEVLDLVVDKFCRKRQGMIARRDAFLKKAGKTLQGLLLEIALPIAAFKRLSKAKGYGLKFKRNPLDKKDKRPDYTEFLNKETLELKQPDFIKEIKNCSSKLHLSDADLQQGITDELKTLPTNEESLWQICNGHHLTNILSVALHKALADYNSCAADVDCKILENELITNYDSMHFKQTRLYQDLKNQETAVIRIFKVF